MKFLIAVLAICISTFAQGAERFKYEYVGERYHGTDWGSFADYADRLTFSFTLNKNIADNFTGTLVASDFESWEMQSGSFGISNQTGQIFASIKMVDGVANLWALGSNAPNSAGHTTYLTSSYYYEYSAGYWWDSLGTPIWQPTVFNYNYQDSVLMSECNLCDLQGLSTDQYMLNITYEDAPGTWTRSMVTVVPESTTASLFIAGIAGLFTLNIRRRFKNLRV